MKTILAKVPVLFNEEQHTYTNTETGVKLSGITSTLVHRINPEKYAKIPEFVLEKAAEHGTKVHKDIELAESIGVEPCTPEGINYFKLKKTEGLVNLDNEYTVTDYEHYATNIDVIYDVEKNVVDLGDFKTTYKFDAESVSWQLSICAFFFEMCNPDVKVRKLYGIWLRDEIAQKIEVERKSEVEIKRLIQADLNDEPYEYESEIPSYVLENEATLCALNKQIKALQEEYDTIKDDLLTQMEKHKDKSWDTGAMLVTYIAPSSSSRFDSKKFKEEHSDLYSEYTKQSKTKSSLKLTFR